jgi:hypothetical protein
MQTIKIPYFLTYIYMWCSLSQILCYVILHQITSDCPSLCPPPLLAANNARIKLCLQKRDKVAQLPAARPTLVRPQPRVQ